LKSTATLAWSWTCRSKQPPSRCSLRCWADRWCAQVRHLEGLRAVRQPPDNGVIWLPGQGGIQLPEDGDIADFSADLKEFFDYIVKNRGVSPSQVIRQAIQTGMKPFMGSVSLLTQSYSVA
ncbi:hypothetical protein V8D89_007372, partial [Ganoderma adspersum]